jgi:tetratricopeptide (TPR) repeat protein
MTETSRAIDPYDANVNELNDKGNTLENLGNHTGSIEYFDKALDINPHYVNATKVYLFII